MFVGDISLGEHFFSFGHGPRTLVERGEDPFRLCRPLLTQADLVIGNLEGPLSDIGYQPNRAMSRVFRGHPGSVDFLRKGGVNVLNIANNHSLQHGRACLEETIHKLEDAGITVLGKPRDVAPYTLRRVGELTFGFVAASAVPDCDPHADQAYRIFDLTDYKTDVEAATREARTVISVLHWGSESDVSPNSELETLARELYSSGSSVVVGHHPHIFYPIDVYPSAVAAYSLGNFLFDLPWSRQLRESAILDVFINQNNEIDNVDVWPVRLSVQGVPSPSPWPIALRDALDVPQRVYIYRHKKLARLLPARKMGYFLANILRGNTAAKVDFLLWKSGLRRLVRYTFWT